MPTAVIHRILLAAVLAVILFTTLQHGLDDGHGGFKLLHFLTHRLDIALVSADGRVGDERRTDDRCDRDDSRDELRE